jgi:hypothetical protein
MEKLGDKESKMNREKQDYMRTRKMEAKFVFVTLETMCE